MPKDPEPQAPAGIDVPVPRPMRVEYADLPVCPFCLGELKVNEKVSKSDPFAVFAECQTIGCRFTRKIMRDNIRRRIVEAEAAEGFSAR